MIHKLLSFMGVIIGILISRLLKRRGLLMMGLHNLIQPQILTNTGTSAAFQAAMMTSACFPVTCKHVSMLPGSSLTIMGI